MDVEPFRGLIASTPQMGRIGVLLSRFSSGGAFALGWGRPADAMSEPIRQHFHARRMTMARIFALDPAISTPARLLLLALSAVLSPCIALPTALAAITGTGDVEPGVSTWLNSMSAYVGKTANGTLTVNGESNITSDSGITFAGYSAGVTGAINIDGAGSTWTGGEALRGIFRHRHAGDHQRRHGHKLLRLRRLQLWVVRHSNR